MTAAESDRIRHLEHRIHELECKLIDIAEQLKTLEEVQHNHE